MTTGNPKMFVIELGKWTNSMSINFILNKSVSVDIKVIDSLFMNLNNNFMEFGSLINIIKFTHILQLVVSKLKNTFSESNRLVYVKLNVAF